MKLAAAVKLLLSLSYPLLNELAISHVIVFDSYINQLKCEII